jgi:glucan phosphorylase
LDFLVDGNGKDWFYNVAFDMQLIPPAVEWAGVLLKESMWAYPREQSAKEQMRKCYDDIQSGAKNTGQDLADKLALRIHDKFSPEKKYEEFCNVIVDQEVLELESWLMKLTDNTEDEIVEHE